MTLDLIQGVVKTTRQMTENLQDVTLIQLLTAAQATDGAGVPLITAHVTIA